MAKQQPIAYYYFGHVAGAATPVLGKSPGPGLTYIAIASRSACPLARNPRRAAAAGRHTGHSMAEDGGL